MLKTTVKNFGYTFVIILCGSAIYMLNKNWSRKNIESKLTTEAIYRNKHLLLDPKNFKTNYHYLWVTRKIIEKAKNNEKLSEKEIKVLHREIHRFFTWRLVCGINFLLNKSNSNFEDYEGMFDDFNLIYSPVKIEVDRVLKNQENVSDSKIYLDQKEIEEFISKSSRCTR